MGEALEMDCDAVQAFDLLVPSLMASITFPRPLAPPMALPRRQ